MKRISLFLGLALAFFFVLLIAPAVFAQSAGDPTSFRDLWSHWYLWALAHPLFVIGAFLYLLLNLINAHSAYPQDSGFIAVLKVLLDRLSFLGHIDSPSRFTIPVFQRSAPPPPLIELVPPTEPKP